MTIDSLLTVPAVLGTGRAVGTISSATRTVSLKVISGLGVALVAIAVGGCGGSVHATQASSTGGGTSSSTGSSTSTSMSTSTSAAIHPCIIGRWRATGGRLPQNFGGTAVIVAGGAGTILSFKADGAYSADFANARPYTGTSADGHRLSLAVTGVASGTFSASGEQLFIQDSRTTLTVTLRVSGAVSSRVHPSNTSSALYSCEAGRQLTLSSSGFATKYVPAG